MRSLPLQRSTGTVMALILPMIRYWSMHHMEAPFHWAPHCCGYAHDSILTKAHTTYVSYRPTVHLQPSQVEGSMPQLHLFMDRVVTLNTKTICGYLVIEGKSCLDAGQSFPYRERLCFDELT